MQFNSIDDIKQFYASLPKQGSAAWTDPGARKMRCGGSELAALLGNNKYKSIHDFIREKVGLLPEIDNNHINLQWGNLFEPIHRNILEHMFNTVIHDLPSIPYQPAHLSRDKLSKSELQISPDGIADVDKRLIALWIGRNLNHDQYMVNTLLRRLENIKAQHVTIIVEQKACITRTPSEIPIYYLPQIEAGMNLFSNVNMGLFTEAVFRLCRPSTIIADNHGQINKLYEPICVTQRRALPQHYKVKCAGISYILAPAAEIDHLRTTIYSRNNAAAANINMSNRAPNPIELSGAEHHDIFIRIAQIVKAAADKYIIRTVFYDVDEPHLLHRPLSAEELIINNIQYAPLAAMYWKLFDITYHFCLPNPTYLDKIFPFVQSSMGDINKLRELSQNDKETYSRELAIKIGNKLMAESITMNPHISSS
jgi:hypothetical protein